MNLLTEKLAKQAIQRLIAEADPPPAGKVVRILGGTVERDLKTVIFDYIHAEQE